MGIVNRRNAVFGWVVWMVIKDFGKRKAKAAVPGSGDHAGLNKSALASIGAAVFAALWFWRKLSDSAPGTGS